MWYFNENLKKYSDVRSITVKCISFLNQISFWTQANKSTPYTTRTWTKKISRRCMDETPFETPIKKCHFCLNEININLLNCIFSIHLTICFAFRSFWSTWMILSYWGRKCMLIIIWMNEGYVGLSLPLDRYVYKDRDYATFGRRMNINVKIRNPRTSVH